MTHGRAVGAAPRARRRTGAAPTGTEPLLPERGHPRRALGPRRDRPEPAGRLHGPDLVRAQRVPRRRRLRDGRAHHRARLAPTGGARGRPRRNRARRDRRGSADAAPTRSLAGDRHRRPRRRRARPLQRGQADHQRLSRNRGHPAAGLRPVEARKRRRVLLRDVDAGVRLGLALPAPRGLARGAGPGGDPRQRGRCARRGDRRRDGQAADLRAVRAVRRRSRAASTRTGSPSSAPSCSASTRPCSSS